MAEVSQLDSAAFGRHTEVIFFSVFTPLHLSRKAVKSSAKKILIIKVFPVKKSDSCAKREHTVSCSCVLLFSKPKNLGSVFIGINKYTVDLI